MLQRIMVPLDGTPFAEAALPAAFLLARRDQARVHLVRVHEQHFPAAVPGYPPGYDFTFDQALESEGRRYLDALPGRIDARDRASIVTAYLHGPVTRALGRYLQDQAIDLAVMTTHGSVVGRRAFLGSVTDGLVRHSHVPVLLLHPGQEAPPAPAAPPAFRRVLVPVDGGPFGDRMIEHAITVAGSSGVEYTLLRVIAAGEPSIPPAHSRRGESPSSRAQHATVLATLEARAETLRDRGCTVRPQVVLDDEPAEGILQYASAHHVDLVAMATRSRGGLERLLLGSVADRVLRNTQVALLLWNPGNGAVVEQMAASVAAEDA